MRIEEITERLKEIGPYVSYRHLFNELHTWHVTNVPYGAPMHSAMLAAKDDADLASIDWDAKIEEGKARYAQDAKKRIYEVPVAA